MSDLSNKGKLFYQNLKDIYGIDREELKKYDWVGGNYTRIHDDIQVINTTEAERQRRRYETVFPGREFPDRTDTCVCETLIINNAYIAKDGNPNTIIKIGSCCIRKFMNCGMVCKKKCTNCDEEHRNKSEHCKICKKEYDKLQKAMDKIRKKIEKKLIEDAQEDDDDIVYEIKKIEREKESKRLWEEHVKKFEEEREIKRKLNEELKIKRIKDEHERMVRVWKNRPLGRCHWCGKSMSCIICKHKLDDLEKIKKEKLIQEYLTS